MRHVAGTITHTHPLTAGPRPRGGHEIHDDGALRAWAVGHHPDEVRRAVSRDGTAEVILAGSCLPTATEARAAADAAAAGSWHRAGRLPGSCLAIARAGRTAWIMGDRAATVAVHWTVSQGTVVWSTSACALAALTGSARTLSVCWPRSRPGGWSPALTAGSREFTASRREAPWSAPPAARPRSSGFPSRPGGRSPTPRRACGSHCPTRSAAGRWPPGPCRATCQAASTPARSPAWPPPTPTSRPSPTPTRRWPARTTPGTRPRSPPPSRPSPGTWSTAAAPAAATSTSSPTRAASPSPTPPRSASACSASSARSSPPPSPPAAPGTSPAGAATTSWTHRPRLPTGSAPGPAPPRCVTPSTSPATAAAPPTPSWPPSWPPDAAATPRHCPVSPPPSSTTPTPGCFPTPRTRPAGADSWAPPAGSPPPAAPLWPHSSGPARRTPTPHRARAPCASVSPWRPPAPSTQTSTPSAAPGGAAAARPVPRHPDHRHLPRRPPWERHHPGDFKPLARAALTGLVHHQVLTRRTKTAFTGVYDGLRSNAPALRALLDRSVLAESGLIDLTAVLTSLDRTAHGSPADLGSLHTLIAVELWLANRPAHLDAWWEPTATREALR